MKKKKIDIESLFSFSENEVIVIGCSGGPDSMALLHALLKWREKKPCFLVCAHVNHNVRQESAAEKQFLEQYCQEQNIVFEAMTIEHYGDDNFHNEARNIRYRFFEELIHKYQATYLVTAHHGDDLVETIMMRLVRGSTLEGYAGFKKMVAMGNYCLLRPFIMLTKEQLLEYDRENHVPYCDDQSNHQNKYTRNRYRKTILPFLKAEEPLVHEKFYKFSKTLEKAESYIRKQVEKQYDKLYHHPILELGPFLALDPFLQEELFHLILSHIYQDDLILLNDKHLALLYRLIVSKKKNTCIYLPNEVVVWKQYDQLRFERQIEQISEYEIELTDFAYLPNGKHLQIVEETDDNSNFVCRLSQEEIMLPLIVRTRKLGDKMSLKGMVGHKKIKNILMEKKIPLSDRDLWPIVTDSSGEIVFLPGLKKSKFDKKKSENYDIIIKYY